MGSGSDGHDGDHDADEHRVVPLIAGVRPTTATVDGLRLRYLDVPPGPAAHTAAGGGAVGPADGPAGGRLPILVIPGHTARIEGYEQIVAILARGRRVLVVDLPGSGGSDKPDRRYDLTFYENVIVAFLDHLGVTRAIPLGGSLGGNLVLRLGHRFPERFPILPLWAPGGAWKAKPWLRSLIHRVCGRRLFWPSVRIQSRFWYAADFPGRQQALDDTFAYYRNVLSAGFVRMYWGIAADQIGQSLFDIAPHITQSSLLMWGDQDHGANMGKGVARLHQLIPGNELVVFPGRRHSLEAEAPVDLATAVVAFLARHPY
ncbi:MAG: putative hydrolase [Acidimicrobiales bacterium]|nr:putative hydrolase [Acidimicrobiales bacterium]